jgi:hypothetical protein
VSRCQPRRPQLRVLRDDVADDATTRAGGSPQADPARCSQSWPRSSTRVPILRRYAAVCVAATLIVPGCDHASLLMRRDDQHVTVGASDQIAKRIDEFERAAGEGPAWMRSRRKHRKSTST